MKDGNVESDLYLITSILLWMHPSIQRYILLTGPIGSYETPSLTVPSSAKTS